MKATAKAFAEKMIRRQFPKLQDKEFEIRFRSDPCDGCVQGDFLDKFHRKYSNMIQVIEIKLAGKDRWDRVPLPKVPCKDCQDEGMAIAAAKAHKRNMIDKVTAPFWMIPPELNGSSFATYSTIDKAQETALETALVYLKNFKNGEHYNLWMRGSYGSGKSHLAYSIASAIKALTNKDGDPYKVGFVEMEKIGDMIKGTFRNHEGMSEETIIQRLIDLDILVIDDMGTESGSWIGKKLFSIINGRQGKATIYTTNFMDDDDLAGRYEENGGKIVSRLYNNTHEIELITRDMRKEKKRG